MAFLGMRGTGDWTAYERPRNYTEGIMYLYVNGSMPLTGIMAKMSRSKTDDVEFNWHEKSQPARSVAITGIYTDVILSSAYTSGAVEGSALYVKMAVADVKNFVVGQLVLFQDTAQAANEHVGEVTAVVQNGASSYVAVKMLEADDNGTAVYIADADYLTIIGNAQPQGSEMPTSVSYDPTRLYNYTQIMRHSLSITRTAKKTKLRTKEAYAEAKREALELHGIDKERSLIWGIRHDGTGSNGKPKNVSGGYLYFMRNHSGLIAAYDTATGDYDGKTWLQGGEGWLDEQLETVFRYGSQERFAPCGPTALRHIGRLVKSLGHFEFSSQTMSYGIKVVQWVTSFGTIYLKLHPMFAQLVTTRQWIMLVDPKNCRERYIDETTFIKSKNTDLNHRDSDDDEFLFEGGWMPMHNSCNALLTGIGSDNA